MTHFLRATSSLIRLVTFAEFSACGLEKTLSFRRTVGSILHTIIPIRNILLKLGKVRISEEDALFQGQIALYLGKNVLLGPNVFIADTNHEYKCVDIPIIHQGVTTHSDRIRIGDDTWIGINSVVVGNVSIGKHCVIGANSVVNKDIPDYCVAGGNPCRILKIFDVELRQWVKIKEDSGLEQYLSKRNNSDLLDCSENEKVFG